MKTVALDADIVVLKDCKATSIYAYKTGINHYLLVFDGSNWFFTKLCGTNACFLSNGMQKTISKAVSNGHRVREFTNKEEFGMWLAKVTGDKS